MSDTEDRVSRMLERILQVEARLRELEEKAADLRFCGGPGSGGSGIDQWRGSAGNGLTVRDGSLDRFRSETSTNFRMTWGVVATGFLSILGAFAAGVLHVSDRIDNAALALIARMPVQ